MLAKTMLAGSRLLVVVFFMVWLNVEVEGMVSNFVFRQFFWDDSNGIVHLVGSQKFPKANIFYPLIRLRTCESEWSQLQNAMQTLGKHGKPAKKDMTLRSSLNNSFVDCYVAWSQENGRYAIVTVIHSTL